MARAAKNPLKLNVASPCSERWENMKGDDRVRHCASCKLNVYNLHEMTMSEVEQLLRQPNGRLCARIYQRKDGTVITADCPVGLRKVRMRMASGVLATVAFVAAIFATVVQVSAPGGLSGFWARQVRYKEEAQQWPVVGPAADTLRGHQIKGGAVASEDSSY
ncbi:MAG: hypothetical protein ACJ8AT_20925 [Hyalangium sp.]|uniref:hypothetical protein n=1 Tax=Hyalangium sp. TaxID=2028555 RepID=UPI003899FE38